MAGLDENVVGVISPEYAWCLMVACIMALQVVLQGFAIGSQRRKLFGTEFFKKNFPKMTNIPKGGYPDMGNGRYAQKLSIEEWESFNNYQRAHYNYVEGVATAITLELVCGLFHPGVAVFAGLFYIIGRALYAVGYRSRGPKGRLIGALMIDVALVVFLFFTFTSLYKAGGGYEGLLSVLKGTAREYGVEL